MDIIERGADAVATRVGYLDEAFSYHVDDLLYDLYLLGSPWWA